MHISFPLAAFAPASRSLDKDVVTMAEVPMYEFRASMGGTIKSREFDPEPHLHIFQHLSREYAMPTYPTDIVPSLHSLRSLQFKLGSNASLPIIATVLATPLTAGKPRIVVPKALPVLLFFRSTADAAAISRATAVCASVRTLTLRLREPEPSFFCASKLVGG